MTINGAGEISWSNSPTGFVLQVTASLSAPVQWQPADIGGRLEDNGFLKLAVPFGEAMRFYRLAKP